MELIASWTKVPPQGKLYAGFMNCWGALFLRRYGLTIVGHSLGAGVAALLTTELVKHPEEVGGIDTERIRAIVFAPPRVMSLELAIKYSPHVNSVIYQASHLSAGHFCCSLGFSIIRTSWLLGGDMLIFNKDSNGTFRMTFSLGFQRSLWKDYSSWHLHCKYPH
jgi:hypothetical protein